MSDGAPTVTAGRELGPGEEYNFRDSGASHFLFSQIGKPYTHVTRVIGGSNQLLGRQAPVIGASRRQRIGLS